MATNIYLGLHGARMPGDNQEETMSVGNKLLDQWGKQFGCPVWDWPAATKPDPDDLDPYWTKTPSRPKPNLYRGHPGYLPTKAVKYLIGKIQAADGSVNIRLFGWSTGAIMLCHVARGLARCPVIPEAQRKVDVCFAIDPLWNGATWGAFPKIPKNVVRWVCVRQNRDGNKPPTNNFMNPKFWQGARLQVEDATKTRYDEINVATGAIIGAPGFALAVASDATHGQMPGIANSFAAELLTA